MNIDIPDSAYAHIQYVTSTYFKFIVLVRREVEPFDFVPRIIYHCVFSQIQNEFILSHVEYLNV